MTDYIYNNGNIQMMIRDLGIGNNYVEYWVKTNSSTFNHQQKWSGTGHGVETFDMNNRGTWQFVGNCYISGSQNVDFTMYNASLGFPTYTYTVWISRATAPPAPYWTDVHATSPSSIYAQFAGSGDGGSGVDIWQIGYGTDPNYPQYYTDTYAANIGGLSNAYTWYFWGRGHNALGWGPWSARISAIPFRAPDAPGAVALTNLKDTSVHAAFALSGWNGGTPVREWRVGYGVDPNAPQSFQSGSDVDITGLQPNQTYYFWAQGRNDVGWGTWSARSTVKMEGPPAAPTSADLSAPTSTTMKVSFGVNADNGKPIDGWQVGYGKSEAGPEAYFDLSGPSGVITGLDPGTLYYFWPRVKNVYGWGPPAAVAKTAQTNAGAWLNVNGVWKQGVPYVNDNGVWKPAQVWVKIAGVWKGTL